MEKRNFFSIGDVAKMFHLSVSSLRHYEKTGLVMPEYVDPDTGYRYYSTRQFEALNTIRYLRVLDMPLTEIADFLQNREVERIEEKLRFQKAAVMEKQKELQRIERKIDNRLRQLQEAQTAQLDVIEQVQVPSCSIVWMEDSLEIHNALDMEDPVCRLQQSEEAAEALVFLGKVGIGISARHLREQRFDQYDGIFLVLDKEDNFEGKTMTLPDTLCVRIRFRGSHAEAPARYRKLLSHIREQHMEITGFSREITIIDSGITNDIEKYVTEITIPVEILLDNFSQW